ncbi:hypothetical protein IAD21_03794 [Abditibacteriota bacterium]|nr:hypothetical protein IAD21_03794 [Abditibacteriota bacterium]
MGDLVLSRDPLTGQVSSKKVTRTYVRQAPSTVVLGLGDGQKIEVTPEHPVFMMEAGHTPRWKMIPAGNVAIGTSIQTRAGPPRPLTTLAPNHQNRTVFNFTVEDFHTYFVGKSQDHALWVHNANGDGICDLSGDTPLPADNGTNAPHEVPQNKINSQVTNLPPAEEALRASAESLFESPGGLRESFDIPHPENFNTQTQEKNFRSDKSFAMGRLFTGESLEGEQIIEPSISNNIDDTSNLIETFGGGFDHGGGEFANIPRGLDLGEMGDHVLNLGTAAGRDTSFIPYDDAEIAQFYHLAEYLDYHPQVGKSGPLKYGIATSQEPCDSCKNVIAWWNQLGPYRKRVQVFTIDPSGNIFDGWDRLPRMRR